MDGEERVVNLVRDILSSFNMNANKLNGKALIKVLWGMATLVNHDLG